MESTRRRFLKSSAFGVIAAPFAPLALAAVEEVQPVEDLMREHGALNRILLIYDEALRRIRAKEALDYAPIGQAAKLVHDFIESYHEKLEEEHLFPRLKEAGKLVDLVNTLAIQHRAGRALTSEILARPSDLSKLEAPLEKFVRMYRPHEAREDTILFPEFKKLVSKKEYDRLGDLFEDREHELFGKEGFEGVVSRIAEIEKSLGIYDISKFTPAI